MDHEQATVSVPAAEVRRPRGLAVDRALHALSLGGAILVLGSVLGIFVALAAGSAPALRRFGAGFLTHSDWNPVTRAFGALSPIYGTLVTSAIALLIALPIAFGVAVFITTLCPRWLRRPIGIAIELLAAVPSIIYGMWGLFVFAPLFARDIEPWLTNLFGGWPLVGRLFQGPPMGIGLLAAGQVLAIMVLPFMAAVMRDVFETVPSSLKEAAYALGATTWEVVWRVVMPYTRVGAMGAVLLGLGRALGETMAVTFVIGNAHEVNASLFMPGTTISSTLANEFTEAVGQLYTSSLIALGLFLFLVTFAVLVAAKLLLIRLRASEGRAT